MEYKKTIPELIKVTGIFFFSLFLCIFINSFISIIIGKSLNSYVLFIFYAIFPYYLCAIFLNKMKVMFSNIKKLIYVLICNSLEKVFWLYLGYQLYLGSPDGKLINENLLIFIQREVFPFYSYSYIIGGSLLSTLIFYFSLRKIESKDL